MPVLRDRGLQLQWRSWGIGI